MHELFCAVSRTSLRVLEVERWGDEGSLRFKSEGWVW